MPQPGILPVAVDGIGGWLLNSGEIIPIDPSINAGTAGVEQLFALLKDRIGWDRAISQDGLYAVYSDFFGHPFDYGIEPVIPETSTRGEDVIGPLQVDRTVVGVMDRHGQDLILRQGIGDLVA
jgi:hypothetical protein